MNLESIKIAIHALNDDELHQLNEWISEIAHAAWDLQIEADSKSGKLDFLKQEAQAVSSH